MNAHVQVADRELTEAISASMVELYATFYRHDRTTATTYINDHIVVCVLENILTHGEDTLIAEGSGGEVIDGRVAFQTDTQDKFTAEIERLTQAPTTRLDTIIGGSSTTAAKIRWATLTTACCYAA